MKKFAFLFLFALAGSLFLASCSGGDDDTVAKPKPSVSWKTTTGFKFANGTETAGNNISFGVIATPSSGEKITRVVINLAVNGGANAILFDSTMKATSYSRDWIDIKLAELAGAKSQFTVTVTQSNNETSSASFIITSSAPARNTQLTANIVLGAQASNVGSFFNPKIGATGVMTIAAAAGTFEFEKMSVAFNVNDALSVSYEDIESSKEFETSTSDIDMEVTSIQASYTVAGATFSISTEEYDNFQYTEANKLKETNFAMSIAF